MGQYRLQIKFSLQFGFLISKGWSKSLAIEIPFISIYVGFEKYAKGFSFFGVGIK